jgi:hypothetical protein
MNGKTLFISVLVLAGLFCSASSAFSQSSPPTSETARQTKALVDKAAALIECASNPSLQRLSQNTSAVRPIEARALM